MHSCSHCTLISILSPDSNIQAFMKLLAHTLRASSIECNVINHRFKKGWNCMFSVTYNIAISSFFSHLCIFYLVSCDTCLNIYNHWKLWSLFWKLALKYSEGFTKEILLNSIKQKNKTNKRKLLCCLYLDNRDSTWSTEICCAPQHQLSLKF